MKIFVPGHTYELANFENKEAAGQILQFIHKVPSVSSVEKGELKTLSDGTTNEEVINVLIDRIGYLDELFPCEENKAALASLNRALHALEERAANRLARGVKGKAVE